MDNLALWIYLIEILTDIKFIAVVIFCIVFIIIIILGWCLMPDHQLSKDEFNEKIKKYIIFSLKIIIIPLFFSIFIPSEKCMYTYLGIRTIKVIYSNEKTKNITDKSILLLEKKIDELLKPKSN